MLIGGLLVLAGILPIPLAGAPPGLAFAFIGLIAAMLAGPIGLALVGVAVALLTHAPFEVGWLAIAASVMFAAFIIASLPQVVARGSAWVQVTTGYSGRRTYAVP